MSATALMMEYGGGAPFTPLALPNLYAWWDVSDSANVVLSGSNVSQLTDKSGNGNHATQATAGNQFLKSAASINGLDSMVDNAGHTSFMSFSALSSNSSLTLIAVTKATSSHVSPVILGAATAVAGSLGYGSLSGTPKAVYEVSATKSYSVNATATVPTVKQNMMLMVWNQGTGNVLGIQDSATLVNSAAGTAPSGLSFAQIGYNGASIYTFTGNICELILCSAALGSSDITAVYAYLKAKWNLN